MKNFYGQYAMGGLVIGGSTDIHCISNMPFALTINCQTLIVKHVINFTQAAVHCEQLQHNSMFQSFKKDDNTSILQSKRCIY